jgi:molecular chaperone DnaK (HSP70)
MNKQIKKVFGIDLGTTYSSIAYVDEFGKAVVIPNVENQRVTPSVVFFDEGNIVVGDIAKECAKLYPDEVVGFIKRSMGESGFIFENNDKSYRPEEISSFILRKVIQDAQQALNEEVTDIVITCPAYFGINEREATRMAGEIAGYNVRQIINEPTAAAIAYGTIETSDENVVLVYDLGGGTFDITMIDIQHDSIEVICTGGDHNLGGKDWDDRIVGHLVQEYQAQTGRNEDILEDPDTCQDLLLSAEKAKKILTHRSSTPISVTHGGERIKVELTRDKFEEITQDLLERTIDFTREMLDEARAKGYETFGQIILVGGATRMPQITARIEGEFAVTPKVFDPDEAVAKGAAIYGWKLSLNDSLIEKIAEKTNKSVSQIQSSIDLTDSIDFSDMIDLTSNQVDELTEQMAEESGYTLPAVKRSMVKITDVTSKSFGIIAHNPQDEEIVFNLILRNTSVPERIKKTFYTAVPNQETVLIRIMESETSDKEIDPDYAVEIGTAILDLPAGLPADLPIEISFELNQEGRLNIQAIESSGNRSVKVKIETKAVIRGQELETAKVRCQNLVIH